MDNTNNTTEQKEKEKFKLIQKTDKEIEIESLVAKEIPDLIRKKLIEKKIDAYTYTPHPLLNGPRIHIRSSNPADDLISASQDVENDLKEFKELLDKEFKKEKKESKKNNIKKEEKKEIKKEDKGKKEEKKEDKKEDKGKKEEKKEDKKEDKGKKEEKTEIKKEEKSRKDENKELKSDVKSVEEKSEKVGKKRGRPKKE